LSAEYACGKNRIKVTVKDISICDGDLNHVLGARRGAKAIKQSSI
jgi:hypothetical protein